MEFFQQYANMQPMYSMLCTANLGLCNYVLFSQIQSHMLERRKENNYLESGILGKQEQNREWE